MPDDKQKDQTVKANDPKEKAEETEVKDQVQAKTDETPEAKKNDAKPDEKVAEAKPEEKTEEKPEEEAEDQPEAKAEEKTEAKTEEKPAEVVEKTEPAEKAEAAEKKEEPATASAESAGEDGAKPKRDPIDPAEAHVLVVEDNVPNFVLIARMLAYMGVQRCEWKTSGWQVVEFADTLPRIDLVLMDIRLPYEDGFQALEKLRSNPRLKSTLVIAVTAEASVEQMNKAKASGFDGFLGKPLDPDRFPDQIRRVLNGEDVWEMS